MASWHKDYTHNDADAIYTRGMLAGFKNWNMKWARRLAKKFASKSS